MATSCLFVCAFVFVCVIQAGTARECPPLKPVHVDEHFLFNIQPKGGFHSSLSSGEDSPPIYDPKPVTPIKSSKKVCLRAKGVVYGKELPNWSQAECQYDSLSHFYCEPKLNAANTVTSTAVRAPKAGTNTIVDTDNKTYLAMAVCADGAVYEWAILTVEPHVTTVHARTLKAFHITAEELKAARSKKYKSGSGQILKGACPEYNPAEAATAVQEGISDFLGIGGGDSN